MLKKLQFLYFIEISRMTTSYENLLQTKLSFAPLKLEDSNLNKRYPSVTELCKLKHHWTDTKLKQFQADYSVSGTWFFEVYKTLIDNLEQIISETRDQQFDVRVVYKKYTQVPIIYGHAALQQRVQKTSIRRCV